MSRRVEAGWRSIDWNTYAKASGDSGRGREGSDSVTEVLPDSAFTDHDINHCDAISRRRRDDKSVGYLVQHRRSILKERRLEITMSMTARQRLSPTTRTDENKEHIVSRNLSNLRHHQVQTRCSQKKCSQTESDESLSWNLILNWRWAN